MCSLKCSLKAAQIYLCSLLGCTFLYLLVLKSVYDIVSLTKWFVHLGPVLSNIPQRLTAPLGTLTHYVIICALENILPFRHRELWRPLAANVGSCDFNDVASYIYSEPWWPLAEEIRIWILENYCVMYECSPFPLPWILLQNALLDYYMSKRTEAIINWSMAIYSWQLKPYHTDYSHILCKD